MRNFAMLVATSAIAVLAGQANFAEAKKSSKLNEVTVNCSQPNSSVQAEVDNATGLTVITISGVCVENVLIEIDRITLRGDDVAPGTIEAADANLPVVSVLGATGVAIDDLTLTGGRLGILAADGAFVKVANSIIENNTADGLRLVASDGELVDTVLENNGSRGILAHQNSSLRMSGGSASDNDFRGVHLLYSSSAELANVQINSNANRGLVVATGSAATVADLTVNNNGDRGVWAWDHSTIEMNGGNEVTGNNSFGIRAQNASTVHVFGENTVTGNSSTDVSAYEQSFIVVEGSEAASVSTIGSINADRNSALTISGGDIQSVLINTGSTVTFSGFEAAGPANVTGSIDCISLGVSAAFASDALAHGPADPSDALILGGATNCDTLSSQGF